MDQTGNGARPGSLKPGDSQRELDRPALFVWGSRDPLVPASFQAVPTWRRLAPGGASTFRRPMPSRRTRVLVSYLHRFSTAVMTNRFARHARRPGAGTGVLTGLARPNREPRPASCVITTAT